MAQCVIDPQSSLILLLARRVNSAAGERGLRRSAMRNYSAPVVTACSIDPPTRPNANRLLLLRQRSRIASSHTKRFCISAFSRIILLPFRYLTRNAEYETMISQYCSPKRSSAGCVNSLIVS